MSDSDLNFSDDEGFSGHEKILLEKHRAKLGKKAGIRQVCCTYKIILVVCGQFLFPLSFIKLFVRMCVFM